MAERPLLRAIQGRGPKRLHYAASTKWPPIALCGRRVKHGWRIVDTRFNDRHPICAECAARAARRDGGNP